MKTIFQNRIAKVSALKIWQLAIGVFALTISVISPVQATPASDINLDFAASYYRSYDHKVGGGAWDAKIVNTDIENSLVGSEFQCSDYVSYLTKIKVNDTSDMQANGKMTLAINYAFDADTTGQSGVAYTNFGTVAVNSSPIIDLVSGQDNVDQAMHEVGTSQSVAVLSDVVLPNPAFSKGSSLTGKVTVNDLEAGETIVLRVDVKLECKAGSNPTGVIQARLTNSHLVMVNGTSTLNPAAVVSSGEQTVPMKQVESVIQPNLSISKTAFKGASGSCPGSDYNEIKVTGSVTYCYIVSNTSNVINPPGAPMYNISVVHDDNGTPLNFADDFYVTLTGLTDQDGDGTADDLAAGATATGQYFRQFDGEKDTTVINTATVSGYTASHAGAQIIATDTTEVYIDPPLLALTIDKRTNGDDGLYILSSTPISFTYFVTNTGDLTLSDITVTDDQGVTVTCPSTTLAVAASMTCTASGVWQAGTYSNIGVAKGYYGTDFATASDASSYFGADPKIDISKSPDAQIVIEAESATFSISVTNSGNVPLSDVVVSDALAPNCDNAIGSLAVSATASYTCTYSPVTSSFVNTASVVGKYADVTVTDSDTAAVTVDYLPKISVTKTANPTSVLETGGQVVFTFVITNEAVEDFTLNSLSDSKFGDLNGQGTCVIPQTIAASGTYSCSVAKTLGDGTLTAHVNEVTATGTDPEQHSTSAKASATVNFIDVLPDISLEKSVNPTVVILPGGYVDYTLKITNIGTEAVTVTSLTDPQITMSAQCIALIGLSIAPNGSLTCTIAGVYIASSTTTPVVNTATAVASDNEGNSDTATASATVSFTWYGRSPGYWKNHPQAWPTPYVPSQLVTSVFFPLGDTPTHLKTNGVFNLNNSGGADSLMDALGYKGGTDLKGAAQILLRASVAALLNEKYYGNMYPGAESVQTLIQLIHDTLLGTDRAAYLALATTLDKWNNGMEGSI